MYNYALSKEIYTQYLDNAKIRHFGLQVEKNR